MSSPKVRQSMLGWYSHVKCPGYDHVGRKLLEMQLPGKKAGNTTEELLGYGEGGHAGVRSEGKLCG